MKQVAIVTGASGGIGSATAQLLADKGYAVCASYYNGKKNADALVDAIRQKGGEAIAVKADLRQEKEILQLFEAVDQSLGTLTALVNNAGIDGGRLSVESLTSDCLESVFATNVFATIYCCREAIKRMKKQGGNIVNITSEAAIFGGNHLSHYAASKGAINSFTKGLAREVATQKIRVNAVSPGVIETAIHDLSSEMTSQLIQSLPMKRMGSPQEVAELIFWLLSESASYMSGAIIPITGSR